MITIILICALIVYSFRTIIFFIGSEKERRKKNHGEKTATPPFISVVIPSRNEENNIAGCINSLGKSTYPTDRFEIIAVNDRSTDNTGQVLEQLKELYNNLVVVNILDESASPNMKGKPRALHEGIGRAKGSIILMTDAD